MVMPVDADSCPECQAKLRVQKSKRRRVITMAHGPFDAREIRMYCRGVAHHVLAPTQLSQLVKPGQRYGYDLIVHVGLQRYLAGHQRSEIRRQLYDSHRIELSDGTVSALCDRFLAYFEALHASRAPVLRAVLEAGYPMHIDATCERGKGGLFVTIDGFNNWVLGAARVPSEAAEHLKPVVDKTISLFGPPIAIVRDMGEGGALAVNHLRQAGIPDLICHYHFLAAVGQSLMGRLYDKLLGIIRLSRCRTELYALLRQLRTYDASDSRDGDLGQGVVRDECKALLLWVLEGDGHSDPSFPFSLPHLRFVHRCLQVPDRIKQWVCRPWSIPERRALGYLDRRIARLKRDPRCAPTVEQLDERWAEFCQLRSILRLSNSELPRGDQRANPHQLPALELLRLQQIKQAVDSYTAELQQRIPDQDKQAKRPASAAGIILRYLRRHGRSLFGHPAQFDEHGTVTAVVARTNNAAEYFFGSQKQQLRRRVGRGQLGRDLEKQPAQAALVANLRSDRYVQLVVGSLDRLPAAFALLDQDPSVQIAPVRRDHRNSHLQRVLDNLLSTDQSESTEDSKRLPEPVLPPPLPQATEQQVAARAVQIEEQSNKQIRLSTTIEVACLSTPPPRARDVRLPPPGTTLKRRHGRRVYHVQVLEEGFIWGTTRYPTLAQVAKAIKPNSSNGYVFFGLTEPWEQRAPRLRGRRLNRHTLLELPAPN